MNGNEAGGSTPRSGKQRRTERDRIAHVSRDREPVALGDILAEMVDLDARRFRDIDR